jgi:hypothetical protein
MTKRDLLQVRAMYKSGKTAFEPFVNPRPNFLIAIWEVSAGRFAA